MSHGYDCTTAVCIIHQLFDLLGECMGRSTFVLLSSVQRRVFLVMHRERYAVLCGL